VGDYCRFLFDHGGLEREFDHLIDTMTTNKTDFFREARHFELMAEHAVPRMIQNGIGIQRPLRVWSSACSTGPEPYTAAMVLAEVAAAQPGFDFQVFGTDICQEVLETAVRAIYSEEMASPIPAPLLKRYMLRSRDRQAKTVRVAAELRRKVRFAKMNLMDEVYPWGDPMDIIFCRNVLIYFDKATQQQVLGFLCRSLRPGGWLFLGHSETLAGLNLPVRQVAPSSYIRL
jgi:chemotaxis protein methyltransferase CheR